jgi:hypothetical protein
MLYPKIINVVNIKCNNDNLFHKGGLMIEGLKS